LHPLYTYILRERCNRIEGSTSVMAIKRFAEKCGAVADDEGRSRREPRELYVGKTICQLTIHLQIDEVTAEVRRVL
jgi:hypothetical protein